MDQKKINLGKSIIMKQAMDDEMAAYAIQEAEGALECIFQERVSSTLASTIESAIPRQMLTCRI